MVEQVLTNFDKDLLFFKLIEFVFVCRLPNYCEKVCFIWKFEDRIFRFLFSEAICFYCYRFITCLEINLSVYATNILESFIFHSYVCRVEIFRTPYL